MQRRKILRYNTGTRINNSTNRDDRTTSTIRRLSITKHVYE
jgi:hypothetical protein